MAAFAAVSSLGAFTAGLIERCGLVFADYYPIFMEMIEIANKELASFKEFVERLDMSSRRRMSDSLQRIPEATNRYQDAVSSYFEAAESPSDLHYGDIEGFRQETHSLIDTLKKTKEEYLKLDTHQLPDQDEAVDSGGNKSKMVGFCDTYSQLKSRLTCYTKNFYKDRLIVSLIGMAGNGKTLLAKKVFEDLDILEWFDCRVWVTVGRKYQSEEITQTIQAQLDIGAHNMLERGCLRESLMGKRYLIVLDDVWDIELVEHYITLFPDTENGSRVLLTTRIRHNFSFPHLSFRMRLLNYQESWHLLCEKVFSQKSCPPELEEAGKKIAEKCDGLPLTIVTVADLLSKAEKTPGALWIEVSTHKKHHIFIDAYDEISKVLYPSYDNLREDSKLCFLYMGVFPPNYEIFKSKLISLWIVEKLIEKDSFGSFENRGVECLKYFALHNLVMVFQISTLFDDNLTERIKACALHSSWWHFCYKEARKSNFFHVLDSYRDASGEVIKSQRRLTIHNNTLFAVKVLHNAIEENCASTTHSLLCLGPYHQYPVPICFGLKLLKKLDALHIRFYEFPLEILELVKLRYLALTCNASLPRSISKLWKLQYLIVHRHLNIKFPILSYFPDDIWDLKRLKHLHVTSNDLPDVVGTFLPNLLTLSDVSVNSCTNGVFGRIPNLKKLGIRIDLIPDAVESLCCFDHVSNLSKLESLTCVIVNPTFNFEVVAPFVRLSMFPLNLKKLHLSGLGYCWKEMSTISSLPNLEVLKLRSNAFRGPKWIIEDNEFPKLYFLLMEDMDLVQLKGKNESFKCLRKVRIKHCYKLRKLRWRSKYELATDIAVVYCNPQVEKEIQKISAYSGDYLKQISINNDWNS